MRQLVYQVCYTRDYVSLYLCLVGSLLKHSKVPKYYEEDFLEIFLLIYTLPAMILISQENVHLLQKVSSVKKLPISDGESFLE